MRMPESLLNQFRLIGRLFDPLQLKSIGYVVKYAHGERGWFLKDHAYAASEVDKVHRILEDVLLAEQYLPFVSVVGIEVVHPVETTQQCCLAASRWTYQGGYRIFVHRQVYVLENMNGSGVVKIQVFDGYLNF